MGDALEETRDDSEQKKNALLNVSEILSHRLSLLAFIGLFIVTPLSVVKYLNKHFLL
jgi:hypothetical protein